MKKYIKADTYDLLSESSDVLVEMAQDPNTRQDTLVKLVTDSGRQQVATAALQNPNIPVDFLTKYAKSSIQNYRKAVALNPSTPAAVLELLSTYESDDVLCCIASNANTPARVLDRLSYNADPRVRAAVAANPSTSQNILEELAHDRRYMVRLGVLKNPNISDYIRKTIDIDGVTLFLVEYMEVDTPLDEDAFDDFARNTLRSANCDYLGSGSEDMDPDYFENVGDVPGIIRQLFVTSSFIYDAPTADSISKKLTDYVVNQGYDLVDSGWRHQVQETYR